jgi:uncharacterized membrane protein HdeD (DUF308 family)
MVIEWEERPTKSEERRMNRKALPGSNVLMMTGIMLAVFGAVLLFSPVAAGEWVVRLVSLILMVTGVVQLVQAFRSGVSMGSLIGGLLGVVVAGVGVMVWQNPVIGSGVLTGLLMIFFIVNGLWKLSTAIRFRRLPGWLWMLFSGVLSLVFVYLLWSQWPLSGAWAIGVLVGLDLLLSGISMIILAGAVKKVGHSNYVETIQL